MSVQQGAFDTVGRWKQGLYPEPGLKKAQDVGLVVVNWTLGTVGLCLLDTLTTNWRRRWWGGGGINADPRDLLKESDLCVGALIKRHLHKVALTQILSDPSRRPRPSRHQSPCSSGLRSNHTGLRQRTAGSGFVSTAVTHFPVYFHCGWQYHSPPPLPPSFN